MNAQVFEVLAKVAAEEDALKREALQSDSNEELASYFSHPANQADLQELAYDVFNQAWTDVMGQDVVSKIIETKTVGLGEIDYVNEDLRGMRAYWQGKGGQILSDVIRYERAIMPREEMVFAVDLHDDEIATNFWGSLTNLTGQAREKMRQLPIMRLVELIQAAIASGTYYGSFAVSTLSADQIDSVLDEVAAHTD
ncbi:MAG: hypothetical protein QOJ29_60, partial [Thermoleophilaceae bacterium]|nr:hypothetical protein [Thermoleophilaceae bacterium]